VSHEAPIGACPRGFTLVELLCALLITAVLLSIAVPAWSERQYAVHRTAALQALQAARQCELKRQLLQHGAGAPVCVPTASRHYRYLLLPTGAGWREGYEWRATPLGTQRQDRCGTLVLDHRGEKRVLGAAQAALKCWSAR